MLGVPSTAPLPTPVPAPEGGPKGDHNLELYGFLQLDVIQDFNRLNPDWEATFRPSRIPTNGEFGNDGQSIFSVRQSRLGVKATGTLANKPYEAKFDSTCMALARTPARRRCASATLCELGTVPCGPDQQPVHGRRPLPQRDRLLGAGGNGVLANPQVRWTFWNGGGFKAAVALEHATNDIDTGNLRLIDESIASNIRSDEKVPDLTLQARYEGKWGHVQLSGIVRRLG